MIHYLSDHEKIRAMELWKEAFPEDTERFTEYYVREKIPGNKILVSEEDGRILSMVHRNPYQVRARGRIWKCDYLAGVATVPDKRKQGYMRALLTKAMVDMYQDKQPFCFLMPADERIYLPFSFTWIFRQLQICTGRDFPTEYGMGTKLITTDADVSERRKIAEWMERWLSQRYEVYTLRDEEYVRVLLEELASESGRLESLYRNGQMTGVYGEWGGEQRLLYVSSEDFFHNNAGKPVIMGRILYLPEFIKVIRLNPECSLDELNIKIRVADSFLPENNRLWRWHLDCAGSSIYPLDDTGQADLSLTIRELTSWLFGYSVPETAKDYSDYISTIKGVFLDEIV